MVLNDPSSFSNPGNHVTDKILLDWKIDFSAQKIIGTVILLMKNVCQNEFNTSLLLDTNNLTIHSVLINSKPVEWSLKPSSIQAFGSCLEIHSPADLKNFEVKIDYETASTSSALQWLGPELTTDHCQPFMFSQCQAIHARSIVPCQDTPSIKCPFEAKVSAPVGTTVIMGAVRTQEQSVSDGDREYITYHFKQNVPIPSYLLAIACGNLVSQKIGPRSSVWAEPSVVGKAAYEFGETERMITVAEDLCGPYKWEVYDILVLPPTFPYGGMENPCLTFVSPTLLAGDRSLVNVIAHEIAHSWTGNLVTNSTWEHFWLNEGHTVYLERLIEERMHGTPMRHFHLSLGYAELGNEVETLGISNPLTKLIPDLKGIDPDESYNRIPYEKGSLLLYYLEGKYGKDSMLKWLKAYIKHYAGAALDSQTWLQFLSKQLGPQVLEDSNNWNEWFYGTGFPPWTPKFEADELFQQCDKLINLLKSDLVNQPNDVIELINLWKSVANVQRELALRKLVSHTPLEAQNLTKIDESLHLSKENNFEIRFQWSLICVNSHYMPALDSCFEFLNSQGRMKYTRPLYRALHAWPEVCELTKENFLKRRPFMHQTTASLVTIDLGLRKD